MNIDLFLEKNNLRLDKQPNGTPLEYLNKIKDIYNKFELKEDNLSELQNNVLQEIIYNKNIIETALKPLTDFGIMLKLSIVGGSLRDLISGHPELINDYDYVISANRESKEKLIQCANVLNLNFILNNPQTVERKNFIIKNKRELMEQMGGSLSNDDTKYIIDDIERDIVFSYLVKLLTKNLSNYNFFGSNNVSEKYLNFHITSINQFNGVNNKKVDLIVSDYSSLGYVTTFDFEICKIYADLKNVKTVKDLIDKIVPTGSMLRDLNDKTFSLNAIKFNEEHMDYFFNKHLLKLKEKYPDFKLNYFTQKEKKDFTEIENKRWIFANKCKMEIDLEVKGLKDKKLKI